MFSFAVGARWCFFCCWCGRGCFFAVGEVPSKTNTPETKPRTNSKRINTASHQQKKHQQRKPQTLLKASTLRDGQKPLGAQQHEDLTEAGPTMASRAVVSNLQHKSTASSPQASRWTDLAASFGAGEGDIRENPESAKRGAWIVHAAQLTVQREAQVGLRSQW